MKYGRYEIIKELGKGNMGVVYQAHDPQIDRTVALKILREDKMISEDFVLRFVKEAKAIGRLSHPNIVTVYDVGQDHGTIYIAMEYIEGNTFDEVVHNKLELDKIIDIGVQVAETLDYAHKKKIVHRDIKPSNMILSNEGRVKLTDFGIARIEDPSAMQQTQAGEILGTPLYMSPEQAMGTPIDGRADLYSLGVILYELTVGRRPFDGNNITSILRAIIQDTPDPPSQIDPFIPQPLSELIMKSLARNPDDRFQTGSDMAFGLKNTQEVEPKTAPPIVKPGNKKKPVVVWLVVGIVALIAVGGGWSFFKKKAPVQIDPQIPVVEIENPNVIEPTSNDVLPVIADKPPEIEPLEIEEIIPIEEQTIHKEDETIPVVDEIPTEQMEALPNSLLIVQSAPAGAQVYIDNALKGVTPLSLELPFGLYNVRVSLAEHYEWKADLELDEAGEIPLRIKLVPAN